MMDAVGTQESAPGTTGGDAPTIARAILRELFGPPERRAFAVRYWDGTVEGPAGAPLTVVLRRPGALRRMFLPPSQLALGEAYLRDDFDVEGSLEAGARLGDHLAAHLGSPLTLARLTGLLLTLPQDDGPALPPGRRAPRMAGPRHTRERDMAVVRSHYDVGNDFYALWLDRRMVYSCAYFPTGNESIDEAQEAKLEYICRKLRLRPGETLLDIGSGWGGLVQYAAERYGVRATGITLSAEQAALARERIAAADLVDRCTVEVRDYRDLPSGTAFDKVVSVGMVEHVGRSRLPAYFAEAYRLTKPGGLFLNHGIVMQPGRGGRLEEAARALLWREGAFIQKYVFPDGELVPAHEVVYEAEHAGFEVRDLENLREHYALTLRHWVRRLEERHERAAELVGETTYRIWRLYMSGSAHGFASAGLGLVQLLLSKTEQDGRAHLPLTRADLYG